MNKVVGLIISVILIFTSIGCWDERDISNTTFVTGIGLDSSDKGYKVTFVTPKPAKIRARDIQLFSFTNTVEAKSISEAVSLLQARLSRNVNFGHFSILIVSEKLAKEKNFNDLMSFFTKSPDIAVRFRLMFVEGQEAKDLLNNLPQFERSLSFEIVRLALAGEGLGLARTKRFQEFLGDLRASDGTALGSRIITSKEKDKEITTRMGGAIFNHWHLAGWLNADEMETANWFLRKNPNSVVVCKLGKGQFSYSVENKDVKITPRITKGQLQFELRLKTTGKITEQQGSSLDLAEPRNLNKVKAAVASLIRKQASMALYNSQKKIGVDYLGFGRALRQTNPELYKKLDWQNVYPDIPVEIKVDVRVPRFGVDRR